MNFHRSGKSTENSFSESFAQQETNARIKTETSRFIEEASNFMYLIDANLNSRSVACFALSDHERTTILKLPNGTRDVVRIKDDTRYTYTLASLGKLSIFSLVEHARNQRGTLEIVEDSRIVFDEGAVYVSHPDSNIKIEQMEYLSIPISNAIDQLKKVLPINISKLI